VHFLGSRRDVPHLLVGADVFAFGSWTESFGLVVAEAMGAHLPVVAYQLPSVLDFATEGVTGHFPAQDDDAGFALALTDLLGDRAKARKLGEAGYEVVAERFPPIATARSFEASYRRILGPTAIDGLVMATGHHRNGILLAPVTARVVGDYLLRGTVAEIMRPFLLDRFRPAVGSAGRLETA